ncbi:protein tyrosine kinase [Fragilaria crotonensis]|nr:protein tyrosine kinase [Fragilaria crotonensis]
MTGATGSRRYMAPEVALSQPYGLPADVYSFGVFLFECCTLIKPFGGMSSSEHSERVALGGGRPEFHVSCVTPKSIQKTVKSCWAQSPRARPDFVRVVNLIQRELDGNEMEGKLKEQPSGTMHKMFRTGFVGSPWSQLTVRKAPRAA